MFLVCIALLLVGLSLVVPTSSYIEDPNLLRSLLILVIFGGSAAFWSRSSLARIAKMAGIWVLIIGGVSVFYLVRSDLGARMMTALDPSGVLSQDDGRSLIVHRSSDGHFWVRTKVNGTLVNMMVDTGASNIVLSPKDAGRIGLDRDMLVFNRQAQTANGSVRYAQTRVPLFEIGEARFYDVPITVNGADMAGSLLGMSALSQFGSFEFRGDMLIMRP